MSAAVTLRPPRPRVNARFDGGAGRALRPFRVFGRRFSGVLFGFEGRGVRWRRHLLSADMC